MIGKQIKQPEHTSLTDEDFSKLTENKDSVVKIKDRSPLIYHRKGIDASNVLR